MILGGGNSPPGGLASIPGDAHDGALCGGVAPGLVVAGEDAHVAAPHEVVVVQPEQRVGGGQELGVEDYLHPVRTVVEQLAPGQGDIVGGAATESGEAGGGAGAGGAGGARGAGEAAGAGDDLRIQLRIGSWWSLTTLWVVMGGGGVDWAAKIHRFNLVMSSLGEVMM